jgi:RHS repeat-associated protein
VIRTGKERDGETGLDYFRARYFSGAQGRFTSPDEPFADQHPDNPQSWNLYQYGYNNPLSNIDIDGRSVWTKLGKAGVKLLRGADAVEDFAADFQAARTLLRPGATGMDRLHAVGRLGRNYLPILSDVLDAAELVQTGAEFFKNVADSLPYDANEANLQRMEAGQAPEGRDGRPVEVHHEQQKQEAGRQVTTQEQHRRGENYTANHPQGNKKPGVPRGSGWKNEKKALFKVEAEKVRWLLEQIKREESK